MKLAKLRLGVHVRACVRAWMWFVVVAVACKKEKITIVCCVARAAATARDAERTNGDRGDDTTPDQDQEKHTWVEFTL